tara:strand:+ start:701 stop:1285 length:585 start_codon:yes stop_codon:yes gene_type:complete
MFNGIIYNQGVINKVLKRKKSLLLDVKTVLKFKKKEIGCSVNCNGACLTLISIKKDILTFYLSLETLKKTNFRFIKKGSKINLEKSLLYGQEVSGNYIQGHIDTTGKIIYKKTIDGSWFLKININKKFIKYIIEKASIGINGVSLTVSKVNKNSFEIVIIPHTLKLTNLIEIKKKDIVNIEIDILAKYLKKIIN